MEGCERGWEFVYDSVGRKQQAHGSFVGLEGRQWRGVPRGEGMGQMTGKRDCGFVNDDAVQGIAEGSGVWEMTKDGMPVRGTCHEDPVLPWQWGD